MLEKEKQQQYVLKIIKEILQFAGIEARYIIQSVKMRNCHICTPSQSIRVSMWSGAELDQYLVATVI